jgi:tRNA(fMet)-specific endonuclease VapC
MILLDTDHISILKYTDHPRCIRLKESLRIAARTEALATTIISADEQMSGWLSQIHRERNIRRQVSHYAQLGGVINFFSLWQVEPFDHPAADQYLILRSQRLRLGTKDLKIAAIALSRSALLLSANLSHFARIPALRVENWLD